MPHILIKPAAGQPRQVLRSFRSLYTESQAQRSLWHWFTLAFTGSLPQLNAAHTNQLIAYYEHLEALLSAVYQLEDPAGEEQAPPPPDQTEGDKRHV